MRLTIAIKLLILSLFMALSAAAQSPAADALFDAADFKAAAAAYANFTSNHPDDGRAWFRLSVSARETGDLATAKEALDKAAALQFSPPRLQLERARQFVLAGDPGAATAELQQLFDSGFTAVGILTGDKVLSTLAGTKDFDALIAAMTAQAYPCENNPRFSEFDFWLGDWEVRDGAGNLAGTNRIEKMERGCLITESWSGASGSTGFSINYLDMSDGQWVQVWNSAGGTQINYRGGLTPEGMRLTGFIQSAGGGEPAPFRGLWTALPDGRVRQFFEQSNDGGDTWTTWFDGYYTRVPADR